MRRSIATFALTLMFAAVAASPGFAQQLEEEGADHVFDAPAGVKILKDIAYGPDPKQRMDVYEPATLAPGGAPIIFMVHGGAWRFGDKSNSRVVENKVKYWLPKGFIFISVNNRLLPEADPLKQADDVAAALAFAQKEAPKWGGDPGRIILMGHSAGAHLVLLISADPSRALAAGAKMWRGTVSLDSGAIDVTAIMQDRHLPLFDRAFGQDPEFWRAVSPIYQLKAGGPPLLLVCSGRRMRSCPEADRLAAAVKPKGGAASVLREDLSHGEINERLGLPGAYTKSVDAFIEKAVAP
jgi:acetyl esterase/lipase